MGFLRQISLFVVLILFSVSVSAAEIAERQVNILGRKVSATQTVSADDESVNSVTQVTLFGKKVEIAKSSVKYRVSEDEGMSFADDFRVNGRKILAHGFVNGDGNFSYIADIPATEISGDIFSYSLGIVSLGVNSGVTYDGLVNASISSELLKKEKVYSPEMNLVDASAHADVVAKGHIEGQVKILFIKGGVGGALNLVEGQASASIKATPATISDPEISYSGVIHLLSGELYGYIGSGKSKWLSHNFYTSSGKCYSFGSSSCQN